MTNRFKEKPTSILCVADLKTVKGKLVYLGIFVVLSLMCLAALIPAVWVIMTALKDTQEIYQGINFFPEKFTVQIAIERIRQAWELLSMDAGIFKHVATFCGECGIYAGNLRIRRVCVIQA